MDFRNELKRQLGHKLFEIEATSDEDEVTRTELGLRLMHFFQYEQDPEFEKMFSNFLASKKFENKDNKNKIHDTDDGR